MGFVVLNIATKMTTNVSKILVWQLMIYFYHRLANACKNV